MILRIKCCRDLAFFLPRIHRHRRFDYHLTRRANLKDIIESIGVPHTEVGHIRINHSLPAGFDYIPKTAIQLDVKAVKAPTDYTRPSLLRSETLETLSFVADVNVIKLGRLMILLGFDVCYSKGYSDRSIADLAHREKRIVLTRDTALLKRNRIVFARRLRANHPYDQLKETVEFFNLKPRIRFFSRCTLCNAGLNRVDKDAILDRLEPKTKKYYHTFYQCPECTRVF